MKAKRVLSQVRSLLVVSYQATCLFCWTFIYMLSYQSWFCVSRGKAWISIHSRAQLCIGPALWFAKQQKLPEGYQCWRPVLQSSGLQSLVLILGLSCPFPSLSTPQGDEGPYTKTNLQSLLSEFCQLYCFNNFAVLFFFWMIKTPWIGRKVETGIQDYWLGSLCK